jgi:C1A family cysteine protease
MTHAKGWRPQKPDDRDHRFVATAPGATLPGKVSLRASPHNGPVLDQGQLGTCVPNSNGDAYRFLLSYEGRPSIFLPSRLYIYAMGRQMEGSSLSEDSGMEVRDALKVLAAGVPPETDDEYSDANPGPFQNAPTPEQETEATSHTIEYLSINPAIVGYPLRSCIAEGHPFTFGFSVPALLESAQMANPSSPFDAYLPMPNDSDNALLNEGHGVQCVGYDFTHTTFPEGVFEIKNSWNDGWGDHGYFFMSYRYFRVLATDIWTLRTSN